jgi:hypothetical protein
VGEGIRLAGGRAVIAPRKASSAVVTVTFANMFSPGCAPIITLGIVSTEQGRVFCNINGIGAKVIPDERGFDLGVHLDEKTAANNVLRRTIYVNWLAMGY